MGEKESGGKFLEATFGGCVTWKQFIVPWCILRGSFWFILRLCSLSWKGKEAPRRSIVFAHQKKHYCA